MDDRRVYIVSDKHFPHGDAGGNRIEYMATCFKEEGVQPYVISLGENVSQEYNRQRGFYQYGDIRYKNVVFKSNKVSRFQHYFKSGSAAGRILCEFGVRDIDRILIYSSNPIFIKQVLRFLTKEQQTRVFYDVVEWDDKNSFKYGYLDPRYWIFAWCFYGIYASSNGVIAISRNIQRYFTNKGIDTNYFPICLDAAAFAGVEHTRNSIDKIRLIYPGNPQHKDDISIMLEALDALSKEEREQIEFHFTSVKESRIRAIMGPKTPILDRLANTIYFHPWLEYSDLLALYGSIDALFMLRFDNQVSQSNFPSKVPELLACGVTVLANDVGDFFNFLSDGVDALKIKSNTVDGCVETLRRYIALTADERRKMADAALRCANEKFHYTKYAKSLVDFVFRN